MRRLPRCLMPQARSRRLADLRGLLLLLASALVGAAIPAAPTWRAPPGQALLLGEVHDNAAQHGLRQQALAELLAQGDRPALLMEQFDREQQAAIDAAVQRSALLPLAERVTAVLAVGGQSPGWQWDLYRPYIALALQHGLPIVAANVSRTEGRRIVQLGLAATGWQNTVPEDIFRAQTAAIEASHCGQVDAALAARLGRAQLARDQFMAQQIERHAARGVVLLAGNGHVRSDIGVPRWLPPELRARSRSVGFLEPGDDVSVYDSAVLTPAQARTDPCGAMPALRAAPSASSAPVAPAAPR